VSTEWGTNHHFIVQRLLALAQVPIPSRSALRMPIRIPIRLLRILELLYIFLRPPVQLLFQIRPVSQLKEKLEPDE
jgi:hypothetical protein